MLQNIITCNVCSLAGCHCSTCCPMFFLCALLLISVYMTHTIILCTHSPEGENSIDVNMMSLFSLCDENTEIEKICVTIICCHCIFNVYLIINSASFITDCTRIIITVSDFVIP